MTCQDYWRKSNMKIIHPSIRPVKAYDGDALLLELDSAARLCYKSEGKINYNNLGNVIASCIKNGHTSVLEHVSLSFNVILDNGILREWTRHRIASYSVESTRYCDYSKDGVKFIAPLEFEEGSAAYKIWEKSCLQCEEAYDELHKLGCQPQERREVLNFSVACEMRFTANLRSLRNLFALRCAKTAHLHMRELCIPMLLYCKNLIPIVFDDIEYDHDFVDKYLNGDENNYSMYVIKNPTMDKYDNILTVERHKRNFIKYFNDLLDIQITRSDIIDTRYTEYCDDYVDITACVSVVRSSFDERDLIVNISESSDEWLNHTVSRIINRSYSDTPLFNEMNTLETIIEDNYSDFPNVTVEMILTQIYGDDNYSLYEDFKARKDVE